MPPAAFNWRRSSSSRAWPACIGIRLGGIGVDDQIDLAGQVVDHRHFFRQHQQDVRRAQHVRLDGAGQLFLDVADGVVAEIARQPAGEARQTGVLGHFEARGVILDELQRIVGFNPLHHLRRRFPRVTPWPCTLMRVGPAGR